MTPFQKAEQLLEQIAAAAASAGIDVPSMRFAQIGGQVVACESLIVGVANVDVAGNYDANCGAIQSSNFIITLARDCQVTFGQYGIDDPSKVADASRVTDADGEMLWRFADDYEYWAVKQFNVAYTLIGGLAVTTLTMTLGVD